MAAGVPAPPPIQGVSRMCAYRTHVDAVVMTNQTVIRRNRRVHLPASGMNQTKTPPDIRRVQAKYHAQTPSESAEGEDLRVLSLLVRVVLPGIGAVER